MNLHLWFFGLLFLALAFLPASLPGQEEDDPFGQAPAQDDLDPFGEGDQDAEPAAPSLVQVQAEYIEVSHEHLTELFFMRKPASDSTQLRKDVQGLVRRGKAKIVETLVLTARPGQAAAVNSGSEFKYPSQWEGPRFPNTVKVQDKEGEAVAAKDLLQLMTPPKPDPFVTRRLGSQMDVEANWDGEGKDIDLRLRSELVRHCGDRSWLEITDALENRNAIRMPQFYSTRVDLNLVLENGKVSFAGTVSPNLDNGGVDVSKKLMLFVRCDRLTVGK